MITMRVCPAAHPLAPRPVLLVAAEGKGSGRLLLRSDADSGRTTTIDVGKLRSGGAPVGPSAAMARPHPPSGCAEERSDWGGLRAEGHAGFVF